MQATVANGIPCLTFTDDQGNELLSLTVKNDSFKLYLTQVLAMLTR
jgi:hypothetical protein